MDDHVENVNYSIKTSDYHKRIKIANLSYHRKI